MAKKDGENFDDDLDLSSFDDMGDFDKNGFDDFSMEEEKDRKPAKGFINTALHYGNKARDGAVEGLKQKITDELKRKPLFKNLYMTIYKKSIKKCFGTWAFKTHQDKIIQMLKMTMKNQSRIIEVDE